MINVLVIGATGYVGGRLVPRLLKKGYRVTCLVRDKKKLEGKSWFSDVKSFSGDVMKPESLENAFKGIDVVYYLVHSMLSSDKDFREADKIAAHNVGEKSKKYGINKIIYLGGLGKRSPDQSKHLQSRHEVGDILRQSGIPLIEFRAAVIIGSGSLSFEMIHHLVNRLPVMICPRWVYTKTQPIAVDDVLSYLTAGVEYKTEQSRTFDIGGPDVMTYKDMMTSVGDVLGLKRLLIQVPVLTPRLSSYWVNLVTPIPAKLARPLIDGLKFETICENQDALKEFDIQPIAIDEAVKRAVNRIKDHKIETFWTDAGSGSDYTHVDSSHLKIDRRVIDVQTSAQNVFRIVSSIGGDNGWYYADWLWKLRGFIDKQVGGVGLRRGRRHPERISAGDALDFWRVEDFIEGKKLVLRAEMKVWGRAWLDFEVEEIGERSCKLYQTAKFYPRGLWGHVYWYSVYPLHMLVFRGLANSIAKRAMRIK